MTKTSPQTTHPSGLSRKQKAFADFLIENPKASQTEAALHAYDVSTRESASVAATRAMKSPMVRAYLESHSEIAQETVIDVMDVSRKFAKGGTKEGASYAAVAIQAAKDIMDRVHGKPTQRTEVISKNVSVNIDLTGGRYEEKGSIFPKKDD